VLLPWLSGVLLLAADGRRRRTVVAAAAALLVTLVAQAGLALAVHREGVVEVVTGGWPAGIGIVLSPDALGVSFALLSTGVLLVCLVAEALADLGTGVEERLFPAAVVLLGAGLTGLFLTGDMFSFYVFFEISMTASYLLSTYRGGPRELRAALVFGMVNLLGSFVFLIAVAGSYRVTGTLAMRDVADAFLSADNQSVLLLAASFFVAFGLKLGLFPFSFWLPIVYSGSRPAVAAILSGAVANIGAYGVLRFGGQILPGAIERGAVFLVVLGCLSILYGGLLAVGRRDPAETLAYSAIGQVGYVLVAVGVGGPIGLGAAVAYTIVNAANKTLLFLCLEQRGRVAAAATAVGALSVAGVPPAMGYLAKFEVFRSGLVLDAGWGAQAAVITVLAIGGLLSLLYMTQRYMTDIWRPDPGSRTPLGGRLLVGGLALGIVGLGIWPEPLIAVSQAAATVLLDQAPAGAPR
jgi:multicomponent Na+:H+ antiporter subunit D